MSKADEIFEKINFFKNFENEEFAEYQYKNNPFKTILFIKDCKRIKLNRIELIGKKILQAINEKCKELDWKED